MIRLIKKLYQCLFGRPVKPEDKLVLKVEIPEVRRGLQANYQITQPRHDLSNNLNRACNETTPVFGLLSKAASDVKVWIYNVSKLDFIVATSIGTIKFPGRGNKGYAVVTSLPETVTFPKYDVDSNIVWGAYEDGKRVAMDIINPDNLGLDQELEYTKGLNTSAGRNLGAKGVFWSLHNPPQLKETKAAINRMKKRYKMLLEEAGVRSRVTPKDLFDKRIEELVSKRGYTVEKATKEVYHGILSITPEHHAAMDYYGLTNEWHPIQGSKIS